MKLILYIALSGLSHTVAAQRVGIRTNSPEAMLDIRSTNNVAAVSGSNYATLSLFDNASNGTGSNVYLGKIGNANQWRWVNLADPSSSASAMQWFYNNQLMLHLSGNGYLGIDTTASLPLAINSNFSSPLYINGPDSNRIIISENGSARGYIGQSQLADNRDIELGTVASNPGGNVNLVTGGIPRLTVQPNGYVGIGTNTAQRQLAVAGGIVINQNNNFNGTFTPDSMLVFGANSGEAIGSQRTAGPNQYGLDFYKGFNRAMSILNNGNVGIGVSNPTERLHLSGELRTTSFRFSNGTNLPRIAIGSYTLFFRNGDVQVETNNINFAGFDVNLPCSVSCTVSRMTGSSSMKYVPFFVASGNSSGKFVVRTADGIPPSTNFGVDVMVNVNYIATQSY